MTHPPCRPHPTSRTCMVQGDHLAGCNLSACRGCVACDRHNPRPVQVPAATSDARKRHQDARNAALMARARESLAGGKTFELPTPTREEDPMSTTPIPPTCNICQRERAPLDPERPMDAYDYSAIQVITGRPLGWYSGDDGEICPEDMTKMTRGEP